MPFEIEKQLVEMRTQQIAQSIRVKMLKLFMFTIDAGAKVTAETNRSKSSLERA